MTVHAPPRGPSRRGRAERLVDVLAEGGWQLWTAVSAGVWLWAFHIMFIAAFARLACYDPWVVWLFHGATVITAAGTALAGWACLGLMRHCSDEEAAGTVAGRSHFLGIFGLLTNTISLALILLEGAYVFFVDRCV